MNCEIKFLLWRDRPSSQGEGPTVLQCQKPKDHEGHQHEGVLYQSTIIWLTEDRRSFVGELVLCDGLGDRCVMPANHGGMHAQ